MNGKQRDAMDRVLNQVAMERMRQHAKWGEQDLSWREPTTLTRNLLAALLAEAREAQQVDPAWHEVFLEEALEAVLAPTVTDLRAELVQVAAVAVQWVEAIDREAAQAPAGRAKSDGEGDGCGGEENVDPRAICAPHDGDGRGVE